MANILDARKEYLDNVARISEGGGNEAACETGGTWLVNPNFLSRLVALTDIMRLSLRKAANVAVGECRLAENPGTLRFHVKPGQAG